MELTRSARLFLAEQAPKVREKLYGDLGRIEENPHLRPDDSRIRPFLAPPAVLRKYEDDAHWIIYHEHHGELIHDYTGQIIYVEEHGILTVFNIGNVGEPYALRRP